MKSYPALVYRFPLVQKSDMQLNRFFRISVATVRQFVSFRGQFFLLCKVQKPGKRGKTDVDSQNAISSVATAIHKEKALYCNEMCSRILSCNMGLLL